MRAFLPQISDVLDEIQEAVPAIFGPFYVRALSHDDFSGGNVLLDERTWDIAGVVGWSGAAVRPFAVNLTSLFLSPSGDDGDGDDDNGVRRSSAFRADNVWQEYPFRAQLEGTFWEEFFRAVGIPDKKPADQERRARVRKLAELMGWYETIVRFGFEKRDGDGSGEEASGGVPPPTEVPIPGNEALLKAWFGNVGYEVLEEEVNADEDLEDWEDLTEMPGLGPKVAAGTNPGSFLSTRGRPFYRPCRPPAHERVSSRPRRSVKPWKKKDKDKNGKTGNASKRK